MSEINAAQVPGDRQSLALSNCIMVLQSIGHLLTEPWQAYGTTRYTACSYAASRREDALVAAPFEPSKKGART
jgi:hypothetical protein